MPKNTLIGIGAIARKANTIYTSVAEIARKVKCGYVGINGIAKLFYNSIPPDPVLIFETNTAGTTGFTLQPGVYEITLIGGGSGLSGWWKYPYGIKQSSPRYISGFCGGTIQVRVRVLSPTAVSVTVGNFGANNVVARASNVPVQGAVGGNTTITGIPNATLIGGGGVSARIATATDNVATMDDSGTMGHPGINTASGSAVMEIILNNPNTKESYTWRELGAPSVNTNWSENTALGRGGGYSPRGSGLSNGTAGFVRIMKIG